MLGKLSVAAAAETVIANYIYDPICDYGHSVRILRNVLRAWAELELANHGIGRGLKRSTNNDHGAIT